MRKCNCCGLRYKPTGDGCPECQWTMRHAEVCGASHCTLHCRGLRFDADTDPDEGEYRTALAEGRFERTMNSIRGGKLDNDS